jgi:hypothetical protein
MENVPIFKGPEAKITGELRDGKTMILSGATAHFITG